MSDDTHGWGDDPDPTIPVEQVPTAATPAAGAGDGGAPPTDVNPVVPAGGDEPPRDNKTLWTVISILVLLVVAGLLIWLFFSGDDDGVADFTSTSTTETTVEDTTTSTEATTTTEATTETTATTAPTSTDPTVDSIEASDISCPDPITLSWTTSNAESVEVSIDDPNGLYDTGPANGSMEVPAPCGADTQTYYVTAIGSGGTTATDEITLP